METECGYRCQGYNLIRSSNNSCKNLGENEHGRLKACADCKIVSDLLISWMVKASQFALDSRVIISKIVQVENECEIEFEHAHTKTKNDNDESEHSYEKKLTLEYDNTSKEGRFQCNNDVTNDNAQFRANSSLKHKGMHYDRKITDLIKKLDSSKHSEEHSQDKHDKQ